MENNKNNKNSIFTLLKLEHWRLIALLMMVYDVIFVNASYFFHYYFDLTFGILLFPFIIWIIFMPLHQFMHVFALLFLLYLSYTEVYGVMQVMNALI